MRHADAQIVNVQSLLAKPPPRDGVTGQLELKLEWREGNNTFFDVGGDGSVLLRRGHLLALAIARGEYGNAAGGVAIARKTFEHLRARVTLDCRWRWEAFAQHEYDGFRRLSVRLVTGTGPALQLVNQPHVAVLAGAAYMLEVERLDTRPGTIDAGLGTISSRASFYATGTEDLGASSAIVQTVYVQPRLGDPGDLRLLGELSVTSKLSKRFALTDGFVVAYDRTPPDGIRRYDTQLKLGLLVTF
ncbi:MAG TPA: DUF481 domain-containing protein [Kofleriaceae bacterium]|nr:DUF481 domain-containing protein [Kofleriaceae bacterium]